MKLGLSGFVRKPFSPFELIQAVRDTLQKAALITENARLRTLIPLYQLGEKFIRSQTKQGVWDELIRTVHDQTGAERIRTRTLLEQYVAPEVAERLLKHGHNPIEVGEIREITVLFADIRNFTPLVTHLNLNDLRAFLNAFFDMLSEIIFRFQGTLDKFMGDAVLALFGSLLRNDQRPLKYPTIAAMISGP